MSWFRHATGLMCSHACCKAVKDRKRNEARHWLGRRGSTVAHQQISFAPKEHSTAAQTNKGQGQLVVVVSRLQWGHAGLDALFILCDPPFNLASPPSCNYSLHLQTHSTTHSMRTTPLVEKNMTTNNTNNTSSSGSNDSGNKPAEGGAGKVSAEVGVWTVELREMERSSGSTHPRVCTLCLRTFHAMTS